MYAAVMGRFELRVAEWLKRWTRVDKVWVHTPPPPPLPPPPCVCISLYLFVRLPVCLSHLLITFGVSPLSVFTMYDPGYCLGFNYSFSRAPSLSLSSSFPFSPPPPTSLPSPSLCPDPCPLPFPPHQPLPHPHPPQPPSPPPHTSRPYPLYLQVFGCSVWPLLRCSTLWCLLLGETSLSVAETESRGAECAADVHVVVA